MLDVTGLVTVPEDMRFKEFKTAQGAYLSFRICSQSRDMDNDIKYHFYQADLWVPADQVDMWKAKIKPRSVIRFTGGCWVAEEREDGKNPWNTLKLDYKRTHALKQPVWYSNEDSPSASI